MKTLKEKLKELQSKSRELTKTILRKGNLERDYYEALFKRGEIDYKIKELKKELKKEGK